MQRRVTKIIVAISATTTVLLGASSLLFNQLAKGFDTGFEQVEQSNQKAGTLLFQTTCHDITCYLYVRLDSTILSPAATILGDGGLTISPAKINDECCWYEVSENHKKFVWESGKRLKLSISKAPTKPLEVLDWKIHIKDKASDTKNLAKWRTWLLRLLLICLALSVLSVVMLIRPPEPQVEYPRTYTVNDVLEQIILGLKVESREQTEQIREFLSKVLIEEVKSETALRRFKLTPARKYSLMKQACKILSERLRTINPALQEAETTLQMIAEQKPVRDTDEP